MRFPLKPYELADDIESFVHILYYLVFRFQYTFETPTLEQDVTRFYSHKGVSVDDYTGNQVHVGGNNKYTHMRKGISPANCADNATLDGLLETVAALCKQHYKTIDEKKLQRLYSTQSIQSSQSPEPEPALDLRLAGLPCAPDAGSSTANNQACATSVGPTSAPSAAARPFDSHDALISIFESYGVRFPRGSWPPADAKKAKDLFKALNLHSQKDNAYSKSMDSRYYTSAQPRGRKKIKLNDGSAALMSVHEDED